MMVSNKIRIAGRVTVVVLGGIAAWAFLPATGSFPVPPRQLPSPNAYDLYKQSRPPQKVSKQIEDALDRNKASIDQMRTYLVANSSGLTLGERGSHMPYNYGGARSFMDYDKSYYSQVRQLSWMQVWQSRVKTADGDTEAASRAALTSIRMGGQIPHGSGIEDALTGSKMEARGRRCEWPLVDKLTADQARAAAMDISAIDAQEVSSADTLREEKWMGLSSFKTGPGFLRSRITLAHFSNHMDDLIDYADQPFNVRPKAAPVAKDKWSALFEPLSVDTCLFIRMNNHAQNALLATSLALRAYYADHKVYPVTLQALAPAYLPQVPHDPFAPDSELKYRQDGKSYKLYSMGPDGVDDGGKPIINHINDGYLKKKMRDTRYVMPASHGDVVAGVNF